QRAVPVRPRGGTGVLPASRLGPGRGPLEAGRSAAASASTLCIYRRPVVAPTARPTHAGRAVELLGRFPKGDGVRVSRAPIEPWLPESSVLQSSWLSTIVVGITQVGYIFRKRSGGLMA